VSVSHGEPHALIPNSGTQFDLCRGAVAASLVIAVIAAYVR